MFDTENTFLDRARYPKGRKTLQAILDATLYVEFIAKRQ